MKQKSTSHKLFKSKAKHQRYQSYICEKQIDKACYYQSLTWVDLTHIPHKYCNPLKSFFHVRLSVCEKVFSSEEKHFEWKSFRVKKSICVKVFSSEEKQFVLIQLWSSFWCEAEGSDLSIFSGQSHKDCEDWTSPSWVNQDNFCVFFSWTLKSLKHTKLTNWVIPECSGP